MDPDEAPQGSQHAWYADVGLTILLAAGYLSPPIAALVIGIVALSSGKSAVGLLFGLLALVGLIAAGATFYRRIRSRGRGWAEGAALLLVLAILPAWGLAYNHSVSDRCQVSSCEVGSTALRPLAEPEVWVFLGLHLATALAYLASRRRPAALYPAAELALHAALMVGILQQALLSIHFGPWVLAGLLVPPALIPCVAPPVTVILYAAELRARLRRRGAEALARALPRSPDSVYREGPLQEPLPPEPVVHRPTLLRALALTPALLGLYAVAHAAWLGRADGALRVFTRTCEYTLSQIPLEVIPADCHYLCTVAARGHGWLVKPIRMGRRGGKPIVVNRQLAVANAFEDLLHERWPRFGRLARRTYDRLGLPVSRYLRARWASDLVYVAMKPAEWVFYWALVLLDPKGPEERIDRMYR